MYIFSKDREMAGRQFLSKDPVWAQLKSFFENKASKFSLPELFKTDTERFKKFR